MALDQSRDQDGMPAFASDIRKLVGEGSSLPPVESWHPEVQGEIDIRIAKGGVWFYRGEEMIRTDVVKLLSSILRKDDEDFFLVTPTEKMKIQVDDLPFVVSIMDVEGEGQEQKLHFSTQFGDCFTLSESHPLRATYNERNEPAPFVNVRCGLDARISRGVYYEMAELLVEGEGSKTENQFGVWSDGVFYSF